MHKKHTENNFNEISGGINSNNVASTPTILRADDFAFEVINSVIDTEGREYLPVFVENIWVFKPKGDMADIFSKKEYKTEILGWVNEVEPGDEPESKKS